MIKNCNIQNPLLRDGTSQQQRLLKSLLPSYVSVDERSMEELISFASEFGKEIKYFGLNNLANGSWSDFFTKQVIDRVNQTTQPHYALFIAFLELFKFAQEDLNTITVRHLDFYYKEVLNLKEEEATPDQVFVIFKLAQNLATALVPSATALDAKKDDTGANLIYTTTKNIIVNKAQVKNLKALFYNKKFDKRLYASPVANSANGNGVDIENVEKRWRTFGAIANPTLPFNSSLTDRQQAQIGFAFSSPVLLMAEGLRIVTIMMNFESTFGISAFDVANAFNIWFSGDKDWFVPSDAEGGVYLNGNTITIQKRILVSQPAVVAFNKEIHKDSLNTVWPVVKIILNTNNNTPVYLYEKLKLLVLKSTQIHVNVFGVKNLLLQNDSSVIDSSKPFQPFGSRPIIGSNFYIGSSEVFSKNLSAVSIGITWQGLPTNNGGFEEYYNNYIPLDSAGHNKRKSENFKANISILNGKEWKNLIDESSNLSKLFNYAGSNFMSVEGSDAQEGGSTSSRSVGSKIAPILTGTHAINIVGESLNAIGRSASLGLSTLSEYSNSSTQGFIRLKLAGADFGHGDFQNSYTTQAIKAATSKTSNSVATERVIQEENAEPYTLKQEETSDSRLGIDQFPLPNEPYTPEISELVLNYESIADISLENIAATNQIRYENRLEQFFRIEPFGAAEYHPYILKTADRIKLLPVYEDEGSLYIGLSDLEPPQTLSILFQLAQGTSDPDLLKQKLNWSYLSNNEWFNFPSLNLISDSTNSLLSSGIVVLDIPKAATNNNTLFSEGLHWIKVSVKDDSFAVCQIIDIATQAVAAVFTDNANDPNHLLQSIPPNTINSLVNSIEGIESTLQPYGTFGGKIKEQSEHFYTRVSERLRHKNRAINLWDYEHLVLDKFPNIYKAKCLNHAKLTTGKNLRQVAPGHISMVIVSNVRNKNAVDPLKPKTNLLVLDEVKNYLSNIIPPSVELHVSNPFYEEIKVHFNVRFINGFDNGFYGKKLEEEIKMFLAPWAYNVSDIAFGGTVHRSVILNFVEEREYVDYVNLFRMDHIVGSKTIQDITEINASTSASILTSSSSHNILVLEEDKKVPDDLNLVRAPFKPVDHGSDCSAGPAPGVTSNYGIGTFIIGSNFVVGNGLPFGDTGLGAMEIDGDFEFEID
jgi:hypothetical protein